MISGTGRRRCGPAEHKIKVPLLQQTLASWARAGRKSRKDCDATCAILLHGEAIPRMIGLAVLFVGKVVCVIVAFKLWGKRPK